MIVRASSIKIVSTAMGIATKDPDDENWDSSQQDKFRELREYRVRLIDPDWGMKDERISRFIDLTHG